MSGLSPVEFYLWVIATMAVLLVIGYAMAKLIKP